MSEDPCNFERALTKLKIGKLSADGKHKVTFTVLFKDNVVNDKGTSIKSRTIDMKIDADTLQECMAMSTVRHTQDYRMASCGLAKSSCSSAIGSHKPRRQGGLGGQRLLNGMSEKKAKWKNKKLH